LKDIYRNSSILLNLIQQINFQYSEGGNNIIKKNEILNLEEIIDNVIWIFQKQASIKNLEIRKNYIPGTSKEIFNQKDIIEYILI
jgi:hypothetical protein